jgi:hypothetical protein
MTIDEVVATKSISNSVVHAMALVSHHGRT